MDTERDKKLRRLFSKYLQFMTDLIGECDDDEMFGALIARIAKHEVEEMYGWYWEANHRKGEEE